MAGLVLTAMVILGMAGSAYLAPLSSNPRGALAAAAVAILATVASVGALTEGGALSARTGGLLSGLFLVGAFLVAWRRLDGTVHRSLADLRPPVRTGGLQTGVHLQIQLAAAAIVATFLVALDLAATTQPEWRLTDSTSVRDLLPPAYAMLAATLALTVSAEAFRVRAGFRAIGRPQPVGQVFAVALWRWAFMGWAGLLLGLMLWADGRWHTLHPAALIVVALVLLIGVPAVGVVTARLLEGWAGAPALRVAARPAHRRA